MPSTSRWLVGSSSTIRSCSAISSFASAIRRRSPPDSGPITVSRPCPSPGRSSPPNSPVSTSRILALPRHSWSARSPMTSWRTVAAGSSESCWVSTPSRSPLLCVTRPSSASSSFARMRIKVVLPSPLRPTTPIRSPSLTPRETPSSSARVPYTLPTASRLTRLTATLHSIGRGPPDSLVRPPEAFPRVLPARGVRTGAPRAAGVAGAPHAPPLLRRPSRPAPDPPPPGRPGRCRRSAGRRPPRRPCRRPW